MTPINHSYKILCLSSKNAKTVTPLFGTPFKLKYGFQTTKFGFQHVFSARNIGTKARYSYQGLILQPFYQPVQRTASTEPLSFRFRGHKFLEISEHIIFLIT